MNVESLRRLLSKYSSNTIILVSGLVLHIGMLFCAGWFILPVWSLLSMPFIAIVVFLWLGVFVVLTVFFINSYDCREQIDWQSLAELDPLTEISNRRGLFNKINASFQRALYSVVVIDIDDFKCINDTYGHNVGDDVLRYLASLLDNMIRHDDIVCRWGGDEFVVILNNAHYSGAEIFIQRLNSILLQEQVHADNVTQSSFPLFTVSAGISQNVKGLNISEIITKADIELLNVKKSTVSEM